MGLRGCKITTEICYVQCRPQCEYNHVPQTKNCKKSLTSRHKLGSRNICPGVAASWTQLLPALFPTHAVDWPFHSLRCDWALANRLPAVRIQISSLIIIMALNVNYGRGKPTVAMASGYKRLVLREKTLPNSPC